MPAASPTSCSLVPRCTAHPARTTSRPVCSSVSPCIADCPERGKARNGVCIVSCASVPSEQGVCRAVERNTDTHARLDHLSLPPAANWQRERVSPQPRPQSTPMPSAAGGCCCTRCTSRPSRAMRNAGPRVAAGTLPLRLVATAEACRPFPLAARSTPLAFRTEHTRVSSRDATPQRQHLPPDRKWWGVAVGSHARGVGYITFRLGEHSSTHSPPGATPRPASPLHATKTPKRALNTHVHPGHPHARFAPRPTMSPTVSRSVGSRSPTPVHPAHRARHQDVRARPVLLLVPWSVRVDGE